jgi:hypothetical protein
MTESAIYKILCRHLAKVFASHGFESRKNKLPTADEFVRAAGEVTQTVCIPLCCYPLDFDWSLLFGFRVEPAVAIFELFAPVEPKYRSELHTCGFNLEELVTDWSGRDVKHEAQAIRHSVAQLAPLLVRDVLPLLDAHRDLAGIDDLMNGSCKSLFSHAAQPYHSMEAIIVAHLARNPQRDRLIAEYRGQLKVGGELLAMYDQLAEYLTRGAQGRRTRQRGSDS